MLMDEHGRRIRKLRLSLTDKCNLRCHYCMPVDTTFMPEAHVLGDEECLEILSELREQGVEEIRLTGGEPLMRRDFEKLIKRISSLQFKKIALTTNGIFLDRHLEFLKEHKIWHLNVSLDSLEAGNFKRITHGDYLERILKNLQMAKGMGFIIKLNVVMMRGVNDHELFDFVNFARKTGMEVRFLELMRIGVACKDQLKQFISKAELMERLKHLHLNWVSVPDDSTSVNYVTDHGARLGFIASESEAFCGACSRWRLSADGTLRACLLKDDGINLKGLSAHEREVAYQKLLGMKPLNRPAEVAHQMNRIGG